MTMQAKTTSSGPLAEFEYFFRNLIPGRSQSPFSDYEVILYIYECLKYYGLQAIFGNNTTLVTTLAKKGQKSSRPPMPAYVLRKFVYFMLGRASSLAFMEKMSSFGISTGTIANLFMMFSLSNKISWFALITNLNLPCVVGGFIGPVVLNTMKGYVNSQNVPATVKHTYNVMTATTLYYKGEKKALIELVFQVVERSLNGINILEPARLCRTVEWMLRWRPRRRYVKSKEDVDQEVEMSYNVKDEDDCVVIEEKSHKEVMDKSGVLVVDV